MVRKLSLSVVSVVIALTVMCTTATAASVATKNSLARWERVSVGTHPRDLDSAASAYDPDSGQLVVFGGETNAGVALSDTWLWSGSTWSEVRSSTHPPAVAGAAMAYDPKVHAVVLFGGVGQYGKLSSQTWLWKASAWHLRGTARAPSPRSYPTMTYDTKSQTVDLFGGFVGSSAQTSAQLWAWSPTGWRQLVQRQLPALAEANMVYDQVSDEMLIYGGVKTGGTSTVGQTWVQKGASNNWNPTQAGGPGSRAGAGAAYDPNLGGVVVFGGWESGPGRPTGTWLWARSHWSRIASSFTPPARSAAVMAFDDKDLALVLTGGASPNLAPMSDQWRLVRQ